MRKHGKQTPEDEAEALVDLELIALQLELEREAEELSAELADAAGLAERTDLALPDL